MDSLKSIDKLIGCPVISLETANELGQIADLLVDPLSGELAGVSVQRSDERIALASILDIHDVGPDAVIVDNDQALVLVDASPLNTVPRAKHNLIGVKVVTEHGQLLGNISNLFLCITRRPAFIYEVRSSLIDKLLGRAFYFAASLSCAFSDDGTALVVTGNPEQMDHTVEAAAERFNCAPIHSLRAPAFKIEVRTHAE